MKDYSEAASLEPRWCGPNETKLRETVLTALRCLTLLGFVAVWNCCSAATMLGIDSDSGNLYQISTTDASLSLIGNTGLSVPAAYQAPADLQFAPDGTLYCFTTTVATNAVLYRVDPNTALASSIGFLGLGIVFEGGLAFSPGGTAYGVNGGTVSNPQLFTLNLQNGHATIVGTISGGNHDINGLAWRSDGMLVGLDRVSNSLLAINPQTAASSTIAVLGPTVGGVGGMTAQGDTAYFSTAGPGGYFPGSNALYSFNLFTGAYSYIGSFSPTPTGNGISGIALKPQTLPTLNISRASSNSLQIVWATNFPGYTLEYATNLHGAIWSAVTNSVTTNSGSFKVTCNRSAQQQFFRLRHP
jgi:hypothetical protein